MISWRMDLTVLTDLSASMFAACFVMLLIFLSLAQDGDPGGPAAPVLIVGRSVLSPEETVRLLHARRAQPEGVSIDLFEDRVELRAGSARGMLRGDAAAGIGRFLPADRPPVRLYVFSHVLYDAVAAELGRRWLAPVELDVPAALRNPDAPQRAWSDGFTRLEARNLALPAFREELAALLDGSAAGAGRAGDRDGAQTAAGADEAASLGARLRRWLVTFATIALPLSGLMVVAWIEAGWRPRCRRGAS